MLIYPLRKVWISADYDDHGYKACDFGWWDYDPALPNDSGRNPQLYAMSDGVVVSIVNSHSDEPDWNGYGNYIIIRYPSEGYVSLYAHIKKDSFLVKVGDKVSQKQPVCRMGNSGYSYGNHLHLEVCKGSSFTRHGGVDFFPIVYATDWHTVDPDTEKDYPISHMVIQPVDEDVTVNQVHVFGKDLRIRKAPINGAVVGFCEEGYYDYSETVEDEYTWCKVGDYWIAGNTDVSEMLSATFVPADPNPLVAQAEVTITDLRIRLEPSTTSRIMGYCPIGFYDVMDSRSEDDYVWFKCCGYWIAFTDGVIYHGSQEDPKDKKIRELEEEVTILKEQIAELEDNCETQARVIKQQIEDFESIRVIAARNIPE
jgi:hypothetical protein